MRFAPIVSMLVMSLTLNAQTIQGKGVRVVESRPFNKPEKHHLAVKIINNLVGEIMRTTE